MEREQNSVDFKEESTLEEVPESLDETLRSVSAIFVAFWAFDRRNSVRSEKKQKSRRRVKPIGGCNSPEDASKSVVSER